MLVNRSGGFWVWDGAADIAPLPTQAHHPPPARFGWSAQTLHKPLNPSLPESKRLGVAAGLPIGVDVTRATQMCGRFQRSCER